MKVLKMSLIVLLALLHTLVLVCALMLYTSVMKGVPWYEPCGMQLLAIWSLVAPALGIIGVLQILLGFMVRLSRTSRFLPFVGAGLLSLPLAFEHHLSWRAIPVIGSLVAFVLLVTVVIMAALDLILTARKTEERAPTMTCTRLQ